MTFALSVVSLFFLIFTSLVGIYSLVEMLSKKIFEKDKEVSFFQILPARGDGEDLEWKARALSNKGAPVIIVDTGLSEEGLSIANGLSTSQLGVLVVSQDEVMPTIKKLSS